MTPLPRDKSPDSTLALVRDGYTFISKRCRRYQTDVFKTRLLFQKTICMQGQEAARVFYNTDLFKREGAAPEPVKATLFGKGGVQGLDGVDHRHRKQMFMSLMSPEGIERLADLSADQWRSAILRWESVSELVLFDELRELICRAVCAWAGVPLRESEVRKRTEEIGAMIDSAASAGPQHVKGRLARLRSERWMGELVEAVREGTLEAPEGGALHAVALHRDLNGELLDTKVAAVEVINVIRPTVAVGRFITFAALALHQHPEQRERLQTEGDDYAEMFVQEVRRFYPFFPFAGAVVKQSFTWKDYPFPEGTKVLLDLYGTNHDARSWEDPEAFRPERFRGREINAFELIPQGGSDHHRNHRCPGEWITIALMKVALRFLTQEMDYEVPEQDLSIDLSRMPALPESGFVIRDVKHTW